MEARRRACGSFRRGTSCALRRLRSGAAADACTGEASSAAAPAPNTADIAPQPHLLAFRPLELQPKSHRWRSARWRPGRGAALRHDSGPAAARAAGSRGAGGRIGWLPLPCWGCSRLPCARTWSAAPLLETSTRQATTWVFGENRWDDESVWTDVAGLAVSIKTTKHFVLLSYQVGLEASYDADGELFMWEKFDPLTGGTVTQRRVGAGSFVESGRLQVRFVVDGVPLREGSAHVSATLTSKARSKFEHVEGTAVLRPGNATRDVRVQWKPSGKLVWSSSPSTGDGFMSGRVLAATAHDTMYASSPLTPAAITRKDWFPVEQSSLNISLNETTAVRFGYALTISAAAPGPQTLASPLTADDYVQARLVVDNTPSDESVATLGTKERAASIAGVLARDVVLDLPQGRSQ